MKNQLPETLARRLQYLREINNLTQERLSKKSRVKLSIIHDIEEGKDTFLSVTTRQNLSGALKIPAITLKEVEKTPHKTTIRPEIIDNIKYNIISGFLDNNNCPKCNNELICKVITLYDLEDQPIKIPKARCKKCPFQIT